MNWHLYRAALDWGSGGWLDFDDSRKFVADLADNIMEQVENWRDLPGEILDRYEADFLRAEQLEAQGNHYAAAKIYGEAVWDIGSLLIPAGGAVLKGGKLVAKGGKFASKVATSFESPMTWTPREIARQARRATKARIEISNRKEFRQITKSPNSNSVYRFEGNDYETDKFGRSMNTSGELRFKAGGNRFKDLDRKIGHQGKEGDVGFHAGADQFGFQGGHLNVSPGNGSLNRREYYKFESELRNFLEEGKSVRAEFRSIFDKGNDTVRPDKYEVLYRVGNGKVQRRIFRNQEGG